MEIRSLLNTVYHHFIASKYFCRPSLSCTHRPLPMNDLSRCAAITVYFVYRYITRTSTNLHVENIVHIYVWLYIPYVYTHMKRTTSCMEKNVSLFSQVSFFSWLIFFLSFNLNINTFIFIYFCTFRTRNFDSLSQNPKYIYHEKKIDISPRNK